MIKKTVRGCTRVRKLRCSQRGGSYKCSTLKYGEFTIRVDIYTHFEKRTRTCNLEVCGVTVTPRVYHWKEYL
jgi:hypothetical protein